MTEQKVNPVKWAGVGALLTFIASGLYLYLMRADLPLLALVFMLVTSVIIGAAFFGIIGQVTLHLQHRSE